MAKAGTLIHATADEVAAVGDDYIFSKATGGSSWSRLNRQRAADMEAIARMTDAGQEAIERAKAQRLLDDLRPRRWQSPGCYGIRFATRSGAAVC